MNSAHRSASAGKRRRWQADPTAVLRVLGRTQGFTPEEQMQLNLPAQVAFERVRTGASLDGDFDTLAAAVNVAMVCSERIAAEVESKCIAGQQALMRMHARHTRCGRWGLDGPGLQEVAEALDIYTQLPGLLTAGQLEDALRECMRRMRAGAVFSS